MTDTEQLYETFGELLYVVAKADGVILDTERDTLKNIIENHEWAKEIKWSFDYEESNQNSVEDVYAKVISACGRVGPSPIYEEFIRSMELVANADAQVDESESKVITSFSKDLIEKFKQDIKEL